MKERWKLMQVAEGDPAVGGGPAPGEGEGMTGAHEPPEGQQSQDWREFLPEDVRGWDEVKNSDTPEKFWDQVKNMRSFLGQSIRVPGPDASREAKEQFYQKLMDKVPELMPRPNPEDEDAVKAIFRQLGQPEAKDDYKVPEIEVPEGVELNTDLQEAFREIAHRNGLTQKQFEGVFKEFTQKSLEQVMAQQQQQQQAMAELKKEWGLKFDDKVKLAEKVHQHFFKEVIPDLQAVNPATLKALAAIGEQFGGEGNSALADGSTDDGTLVPMEAKMRLNEILSNREHPYWNASDPAHADAVKLVVELTKQAHPELPTSADNMRAGAAVDLE